MKSMKQLCRENSFSITAKTKSRKDVDLQGTLQAMSGAGIHKAKKGKGSFRRKRKHPEKAFGD